MTYFEGFVSPVPTANRTKFIEHARRGDPVFLEHGATRVVDTWQDDVAHGDTTDFFRAVDAKEDESVTFGWIEWPSKAERQAMFAAMEDLMKSDERFSPERNPMPFDGMRMIYGGFVPFFEGGEATPGSYVQGFVIPVPAANKDSYRQMAAETWSFFRENGAYRMIEAWEDDVPEGKVTDFRRGVKAEPDEKVVFSFLEWPSRIVAESAHERMMQDERMQKYEGREMPFDGQRMVWGGFAPLVDLTRDSVLA